MLELLNENSSRLLYVTKKTLGDENTEIVPRKGDLLDETTGCAISYEPGHGYLFSSHTGDRLVSSFGEAATVYNQYCAHKGNAYITLAKRNPENGHEFILRVQKLPHAQTTTNSKLLLVYSWALLFFSISLVLILYFTNTFPPNNRLMHHHRHRRRVHFS